MAYKAQLEQWNSAVIAYDEGDVQTSLNIFQRFSTTSRMLYNMGLIHYELGNYKVTLDALKKATALDRYFALGYFLKGLCYSRLDEWGLASSEFDLAYNYLRGNPFIDYNQIGCSLILYECEILYNKAVCEFLLGNSASGKRYLKLANMNRIKRNKHSRIEEVFNNPRLYSERAIYEISRGKLFRPSADKVKNTARRDYLGKSMLIRTADKKDTHLGFSGTISKSKPRSETIGPIHVSKSADNSFNSPSSTYKDDLKYDTSLPLESGLGRPKAPRLPGMRSTPRLTSPANMPSKLNTYNVSDLSLSAGTLVSSPVSVQATLSVPSSPLFQDQRTFLKPPEKDYSAVSDDESANSASFDYERRGDSSSSSLPKSSHKSRKSFFNFNFWKKNEISVFD